MRREQAFEGFAGVEVLVCNAALRPHKPVWEIDYEEWHQVLHKGTPQAMANAALLLASDEPSFVTNGRYM